MSINRFDENGVTFLEIIGRVDFANAAYLEEELKKCLSENRSAIVLDCSQLDYISSAGLRILITYTKKTKLVLLSPSEDLKYILHYAGLDKVLKISPSKSELKKYISI
ncbi:MAG: STAS domain-containing protein [Verrucomicrobia bacterium]|nr:STAS domain-containing protein [Verrucomicrobiota bacterium]NDE62775.1 anti-sigma factor antagonist [Chlamydiota bacterium]